MPVADLAIEHHFSHSIATRQANDPLRQWEPHFKQRQFIASVLGDECYENWAFWSNRAGKTIGGTACGSILARFGIEPTRPAVGRSTVVYDRATTGWVVSLDFPSSHDVVQPKYFDNGFVPAGQGFGPFIPAYELAEPLYTGGRPGWNQGTQTLRLKNGSLIGFKSAASGRDKFQGTERDWVHFDEEPPYEIYSEATLRVGTRPLRVFGTCTLLPPEGQVGGVSWAFEHLIQPWQAGKRPDIRIFEASIYDNPHIPQQQLRILEARYPEGSVERRIRLNGELLPGLMGARAYGAFDPQLHVSPTGPPEWRRPLAFCLDFNVEPMCAVVGQRRNGLFLFHKELVIGSNASTPEMADLFREAYPSHGAEVWIYGDATGSARNVQTGRTDYQVLLSALRDYPVPLRLKLPAANPSVPARINAMNRAFKDEHGVIGVQVDPSCDELIKDFLGVLRDPRGGLKKTFNPKDPYFYRTHACLDGDARIETVRGAQRIADIAVGEGLWLPHGICPVRAVHTHIASETWTIGCADGRQITGTPQHKLLTSRGLVTMDALGYGDTLITQEHALWRLSEWCMQATHFTLGLRDVISALAYGWRRANIPSAISTVRSGRLRMGLFPLDIISTTQTIIRAIMPWKTWSAWMDMPTNHITENSNRTQSVASLMPTAIRQPPGIKVRRGVPGTAYMAKPYGMADRGSLASVWSAVVTCLADILAHGSSVQGRALRPSDVEAALIMNNDNASIVAAHLPWENIKRNATAIVSVRHNIGAQRVYDLTVPFTHCYLVDGCLSSNSDAATYFVNYEQPITTEPLAPEARPTVQGIGVDVHVPQVQYGRRLYRGGRS